MIESQYQQIVEAIINALQVELHVGFKIDKLCCIFQMGTCGL